MTHSVSPDHLNKILRQLMEARTARDELLTALRAIEGVVVRLQVVLDKYRDVP